MMKKHKVPELIALDEKSPVVCNVEGFQEVVQGIAQKVRKSNPDHVLFYRGQSNCDWKIVPALFREKKNQIWVVSQILLRHFPGEPNLFFREQQLISQIECRYPNLFDGCTTMLDRLTVLQHWGVPTRLVDVTLNPLVALWFATERNIIRNEVAVNGNVRQVAETETDGRVFIWPFAESEANDSFAWSDGVSRMSEIDLYHIDDQKINPGKKKLSIRGGELLSNPKISDLGWLRRNS